MVNGVDVNKLKYKHIAKYVPQEDNLYGTMTVAETLKFSAELSLSGNLTALEKQQRVDMVSQELGKLIYAN